MAGEGSILFSVNDGIGVLQLNRPEVLNALNREVYAAMAEKLEEVAEDEAVRVLIFAGEGRAFCAGTDITELDGATAEEARELALVENHTFNQIEDFSKPTLAPAENREQAVEREAQLLAQLGSSPSAQQKIRSFLARKKGNQK